jgi:hypothetical protein
VRGASNTVNRAQRHRILYRKHKRAHVSALMLWSLFLIVLGRTCPLLVGAQEYCTLDGSKSEVRAPHFSITHITRESGWARGWHSGKRDRRPRAVQCRRWPGSNFQRLPRVEA